MSLRAGELVARLGGPRLALAILLEALGTGTVMPLSVLFFTLHEHLPVTTVGLGLTIGGAVALLSAPFTGQFIDAVGPKRALLVSWIGAAAGAASWLAVHSLFSLTLVESVTAVFGGMGWNAGALFIAGRNDRDELSQVMAAQYSLRNLGFGLGGLLATVALAAGGTGFVAAVLINALSYVVAVGLALWVPAPPPRPVTRQADATTIWTVLADRRYVALALLGSLIAFNQVGLSVVLPLWVVHHTAAPRALVGLLFALNTLMVVACTMSLSARFRRLADAPLAYLLAAVAMMLAAGAYLGAHPVGAFAAVVLLMLGTALLTLTEMLVSAATFVVSLGLADTAHQGKYLSVFGIGSAIEGMAGPTAGTALVSVGLLLPWPALALIVGTGALASAALVRGAEPHPSVAEEAAG